MRTTAHHAQAINWCADITRIGRKQWLTWQRSPCPISKRWATAESGRMIIWDILAEMGYNWKPDWLPNRAIQWQPRRIIERQSRIKITKSREVWWSTCSRSLPTAEIGSSGLLTDDDGEPPGGLKKNPFPLGAHKNLRFIIFPYNTSPVVPQKKWLTPSQVSPKIAVLLQSCLFIIWWLPEIGVPLIIHFKKISHYKPSSYWVPPMTMETPIYCHIICYHEYHLGTFDPLKNSGSTWWPIHSRSSGDGAGCPKTSSPLSTSWVHAGWCFENHGKHHKWIYMVIVTAVVDLSGYTNCIKWS